MPECRQGLITVLLVLVLCFVAEFIVFDLGLLSAESQQSQNAETSQIAKNLRQRNQLYNSLCESIGN